MQSHTKSKLLAFLHPKQIKGERKHTFTLLSQAKEKEEFAFDTRSQSVSIFLVVSWGHLGQKENLILFQQSSFLGEMLEKVAGLVGVHQCIITKQQSIP